MSRIRRFVPVGGAGIHPGWFAATGDVAFAMIRPRKAKDLLRGRCHRATGPESPTDGSCAIERRDRRRHTRLGENPCGWCRSRCRGLG